MLDLNLRIFSTHEEDGDCKVPTSMFSEEEEASINLSDKNFISFGILKREEDVKLLPPPPPPPPPPESELSGGSEWLNLSLMQRNKQEMVMVNKKKSRRGPRSRSSHYRGVTFYRRTGRWESHIWDCGKQVYLGGFDTAYIAARAYDRAALKFRGLHADINFIVDDYKHDIEKVKNLSKAEFLQTLRRESASLARGGSKYKDLTLQRHTHMQNDHTHLFKHRGWDAAATKCSDLRIEGNIELRAHTKGNEFKNLELSLGSSSSSENIRMKSADYCMGSRCQKYIYG